MNEIIWYISYLYIFLYISIMSCHIIYHIYLPTIYISHHIFFIHSSMDWYLVCFHFLVIVNNATINIRVHISFYVFNFNLGEWEREREREAVRKMGKGREGEWQKQRHTEREKLKQASCWAQSLTQGSIQWPWDHNLSQNQELDAQQTKPPRYHIYFELLL